MRPFLFMRFIFIFYFFSVNIFSAWIDKPISGEFYLFVNKDKNELHVKSLKDPKKIFRTFRAISGENFGDKKIEGDKRTPEGIYFINGRIPNKRLQALHGPAAFELNYPNPVDRINTQTGSGIWIHGVDAASRMEKRFDTRGCVALANADILELAEILKGYGIPVVIVANEEQAAGAGLVGAEIGYEKRISEWVDAWASKDADKYLAFYDENFYARKMNYTQWSTYKKFLAKAYSKIEVKIENLSILRHGKYAIAVFYQHYKSNRFESNGIKRLYLAGEPSTAKILSEEMENEVTQVFVESN